MELAEKDHERERLAGKATVENAVKQRSAAATKEIAIVDEEVAEEARAGDLGDAIDRLRGGV